MQPQRNPRNPLPEDYTDFEVTDYDVEWVGYFDGDIGGYDGKLPACTILSADVETPDGDIIKVSRPELLKLAGLEAVHDAEKALEEREMMA